MDTLTHALSGALLARATEPTILRPDQLPRRLRMWIGFWAAAFPDSDFIVRFVDPLTYLTLHRGITHSVLLLPVWAIGLSLLFALLVRGKYSWRAFATVVAMGIGIHIAGDVITAFGTMILAPFSNWRASIPTTFIIDLLFTAIIVVGLITSFIWRQTRLPAVAALAVLVGYVGFQAVLHQRAISVGQQYVTRHGLEQTNVQALPQPFSPFNWMIVVPQKESYFLTYVSLSRTSIPEFPPEGASWLRQVYASYNPARDAIWKEVPRFGSGKNAVLAGEAWDSEALASYRHFTLFPAVYGVDRYLGRQCVWFHDLRFAMVGRTLPFRYGACRNKQDPTWRIHRLTEEPGGPVSAETVPH